MRTCVVACGQYRTFDKCLNNLLEKIILPNNADVFLVLSQPADYKYAADRLGDRLKKVYVITDEDAKVIDGVKVRAGGEMHNRLQHYKPILGDEYHYAVTFYGSTGFQFLCLYKSYDVISEYENLHNFKYDYIVKVRTDMFIGEELNMLDMYYMNYKKDTRIKQLLQQKNIKFKDQKTLDFLNFLSLTDYTMDQFLNNYRNSTLDFENLKEVRQTNTTGDTGRLISYLQNNQSATLGGAYCYNRKLMRLYDIFKNSEKHNAPYNLIYLVNDWVIICKRNSFEYIKNFILHIATYFEDNNAFFWTPECQLFSHINYPKDNYVIMSIFGEKVV